MNRTEEEARKIREEISETRRRNTTIVTEKVYTGDIPIQLKQKKRLKISQKRIFRINYDTKIRKTINRLGKKIKEGHQYEQKSTYHEIKMKKNIDAKAVTQLIEKNGLKYRIK